jgi:hypothetical protein
MLRVTQRGVAGGAAKHRARQDVVWQSALASAVGQYLLSFAVQGRGGGGA